MFEKCEETIEKQFDIVKILNKLHRANSMLTQGKDSLQKKFYKYNKKKVILEHGHNTSSNSSTEGEELNDSYKKEDLLSIGFRKIAALSVVKNMNVDDNMKKIALDEVHRFYRFRGQNYDDYLNNLKSPEGERKDLASSSTMTQPPRALPEEQPVLESTNELKAQAPKIPQVRARVLHLGV